MRRWSMDLPEPRLGHAGERPHAAGLAGGGARGKRPRRRRSSAPTRISHQSGRPSGTLRWRGRSACPRITTVRGSMRGRSSPPTARELRSSRQDLRLYGLQLPERVAIFSLQAASGGTFQNIVHDRRALCGNRAVAVRRKQVTFSPQSADRQLGRYHLVPPPRSAPGRRVFLSCIPEAGGRAEPKRGPIGSTNTSPAVRVG